MGIIEGSAIVAGLLFIHIVLISEGGLTTDG